MGEDEDCIASDDLSQSADGDAETGADDLSDADLSADLATLAAAARDAGPCSRAAKPVDLGVRVLALVVDGCVIMALSCPLAIAAGIIGRFVGERIDSGIIGGAVLLGALVMYTLTEVLGTATPGKFLLDLQVARSDGHPASVARRTRRWVVRNAPVLLTVMAAAFGMVARFPIVATSVTRNLFSLAESACIFAAVGTGGILVIGLLGSLQFGLALHDWLTGTSVFRAMDVTASRSHGFQPTIWQPPLPLQPLALNTEGRSPDGQP